MNTSGRRQAQARNGYKHMRPQQRPHYSKISLSKSMSRLRKTLEKQKLMQGRKAMAKK